MLVAASALSGFAAITGSRFPPTDMQSWAEAVPLGEGPVLAVVEDVTGSGKTEAAIVLAHRLMQSDRAEGIYIALPTIATANAMYGRMAESYRRLFVDDGEPSLALAHSARHFDNRFRDALHFGTDGCLQGLDDEDLASDGNGSAAICHAWIGDSARKTFLAQMAVGTIDQALLAVLPTKYQSLRLVGMARRVPVFRRGPRL